MTPDPEPPCKSNCALGCLALLAVAALAVYGCSKISSAPKSPEVEFEEIFGHAPPAAVADIRYHERSSYFGGWCRWLSFSCDSTTFDAFVKKGGYKQSTFSMTDSLGKDAPAWWPKTDPPRAIRYSLSQEDTAMNEGYQFLEFIWYDTTSRQVYLYKSYWD